ncbi:MAG: YCF48-related protein [Syntrophales bacterium]|nr:YCF48-related protein [Syntrophales bacterium]
MLIKRLTRIVFSAMPVVIIAGLLYVALFVKPQTREAILKPYPIVKRDRIYGVALPTPTTIWAVGSHGKILRSEDTGKSWILQASPMKEHLQDIAAWDDKRACIVGNRGLVMVTRDGGASWTQVKTPLDEAVEMSKVADESGAGGETAHGWSITEKELEARKGVAGAAEAARKAAQKLMRVEVFPDGSAWAVGEMGIVLYSKDFGSMWERRMKEEDVSWNDCAFIDKKGWLVGELGRIMRTDDNGQTWTAVKSPVETSLLGVAFRDQEHGVAVGLDGIILVTENSGKRWVQAPKVSREHLFAVIWDGLQWVAVGDKGVMFKGDPSGLNWSGGRITDLDTSWYTKVQKVGDRYYLAGDRLTRLEKGVVEFFDRKT